MAGGGFAGEARLKLAGAVANACNTGKESDQWLDEFTQLRE
jgi:hypothetical protein